MTDELGLMQEFIEEMALEVKQSKRKAKSEQKKAASATVHSKKRLEVLRKLKTEVSKFKDLLAECFKNENPLKQINQIGRETKRKEY